MANGGVSRLSCRARRSVIGLLLPCSMAAAGPPAVDLEWRDRFVMGVDADTFRHVGKAWAKAQQALSDARATGDVRQEMRAAARYLAIKPVRGREDCDMLTHYVDIARAGGAAFERELFDLGAAAAWLEESVPCPSKPTGEQMQGLAQRLGDPARMYYVMEVKFAEVDRDLRWAEMTALRSRQLAHAIADFQRAYCFWSMSEIELSSDLRGTQAKVWLVRALQYVDSHEFVALAADIDGNLAVVEFRDNNPSAAMVHMRRSLARIRSGAKSAHGAGVDMLVFAKYLTKLDRTTEALDLLRESERYELANPSAAVSRASAYLAAYAKLGTREAYALGEVQVQRIHELVEASANPQLLRPSVIQQMADFYASFGQWELAFKAQRKVAAAIEAQQQRSRETTRLELQEKLNVALKDQENTRLKAEAELQAERQRGWILAFGAVAVGAVAAAAALAVAVRRGRRLAKVSAELADRNQALEQRSASRIRLLAAACHDLRQPAHALGMLAELGGDANVEPGRYTAWLQSVRRSTASLGDMLDELMDLGRLDGGHYMPHVSDVSLGELLQEVMLHFGPLARRKGLTLEAPPVNVLVMSDRHLLRRMLFNLVSNAIKYTDAGSVRVVAEPAGGEVCLTVQDTGPGIPQDKLDDVFRDYVRLNPLKAAEGLGIGLSIVRRSAELLGHRLTLASPPGEGTTVSLLLPISASEMATEPGERPADAASTAGGVLAVLEDDADVRDAMAALLRRWHYTVFAAADAQAVLTQLAPSQARPALVITDLHLGATDGLAEVAQLRAALQAPELPALLVTGDLDAAVASQAAQAHVFVAHKPLAPRQLAALVAQLLAGAGGLTPSPSDASANSPAA
ncbi:MAG: hybrid sensor histidine kinase/response regulator [Burkholderiales bacterium]|nr:MAG: hybrid sensor histidine kinase/response regulator [Burkholderiales bacterium]